jgi:hypothetical protein
MIILRVSMGRGLLKDTVNEIVTSRTTLAFADPPMVHRQNQGVMVVRTTIRDVEDSILGPGTPATDSDVSIKSA